MKIRWFLGTKRRKIHQVQARLHLSVKSVFSTPVQYQCRTSQVILQVIRLWDVSASVILDVTFEAVFTDAKLQECPEISVLHFKPPHICACTCILAIPKGQNSTRSWNQQVWWCVIAQLWAFTAGGAWTCKYVQVLSSVFIWTLLLRRLSVAAFHLQLYSESLQRTFNDTKSRRMTFL